MISTTNGVGGLVPEVQLVQTDINNNATWELANATTPTLNTTMNWGTIACNYMRVKTLYLLVTTAFAWVTSGQATLQLYVGRTSANASTGALDAQHLLVGTAQNLGASGTSLAINTLYRFSPAQIADLQWFDPYVGVQVVFPSTPSVGAATLYVESGAV
jgi:hypothetical protein